jgi:hypothetical protein
LGVAEATEVLNAGFGEVHGSQTQNRGHDLAVVAHSAEASCVLRPGVDLKAGASLFREVPSMVVAGGEFQVRAGDFHFLAGVLDAQVRETDLPINNGKVQLLCKSFHHPLYLLFPSPLGLAKFSIEFFLEFVVELNLEYLATFAFDLLGGLVIQAV